MCTSQPSSTEHLAELSDAELQDLIHTNLAAIVCASTTAEDASAELARRRALANG